MEVNKIGNGIVRDPRLDAAAMTERPAVSALQHQQTGVRDTAFAELLKSQLVGRQEAAVATEPAGVKFSSHALRRLDSRRLELTPDQQQRLSDAVDAAAQKGARESLVLLDRTALVVSVKNRTVITAMPYEEYRQHIFTNIDSAVLL